MANLDFEIRTCVDCLERFTIKSWKSRSRCINCLYNEYYLKNLLNKNVMIYNEFAELFKD